MSSDWSVVAVAANATPGTAVPLSSLLQVKSSPLSPSVAGASAMVLSADLEFTRTVDFADPTNTDYGYGSASNLGITAPSVSPAVSPVPGETAATYIIPIFGSDTSSLDTLANTMFTFTSALARTKPSLALADLFTTGPLYGDASTWQIAETIAPNPAHPSTTITITRPLDLSTPSVTLATSSSGATTGAAGSTSASGGATATGTADTLVGADQVTRSVVYASPSEAALAAPLIAALDLSRAIIVDQGTPVAAVPAGDYAAVDASLGSVTLYGGVAAHEEVFAGDARLVFVAGSGSGTLIAGAGADVIDDPLGVGGNWDFVLGGASTVVAASGDDTITTGPAGCLVFLGTGASSVEAQGADTVIGASGDGTVTSEGSGALVFALGGGRLTMLAVAGASTAVGGAAGATLVGGTAGTLLFGNGPTAVYGVGSADTVACPSGSLLGVAGQGGGLYFGGPSGGNRLSTALGPMTAFGGGAGDVLTNAGASACLFAGGPGAETLTGAASTGANTFYAGSGADLLVGGAGPTALVAGLGQDTLAGGGGLTLFVFEAGRVGGADTITGWDPTRDFVELIGFGPGADGAAYASATLVGASTRVALSDGTQLTFAGVSHLDAFSFT